GKNFRGEQGLTCGCELHLPDPCDRIRSPHHEKDKKSNETKILNWLSLRDSPFFRAFSVSDLSNFRESFK
ncbi:MAG: hypothetical protein SVX43_19015, partial [Cyanobacteriota bacterium]|nr:hypothetical protein [Cyanobacteriota bacterium]